jgi:uncharacterized protein YqgV (UPF0045/DUF77 family)
MKITAEISLYPLAADYLTGIESFICEVEGAGALEVTVNQMSTQLRGELHDVLDVLERALARSFVDGRPQVLVAKFLNADLPVAEPVDRARAR